MTVRVRNSRSWLTTTVPARRPVHEALQPLQAVQVEVVGRLVEQEDVVAGQQQGGESGAGRLAAGEGRSSAGRGRRQAEGVGDLLGPLVQVGAAEAEPALQARWRRRRRRPGAPSTRAWVASSIARWASATPVRRARNSRTVSPAPALGLLRQVPDGRGRRGEPQLALLRGGEAGEQAQQGGLARRRWRRRARSRPRARRRGRVRRTGSGRRVRRRGSWRREWQSSGGDFNGPAPPPAPPVRTPPRRVGPASPAARGPGRGRGAPGVPSSASVAAWSRRGTTR